MRHLPSSTTGSQSTFSELYIDEIGERNERIIKMAEKQEELFLGMNDAFQNEDLKHTADLSSSTNLSHEPPEDQGFRSIRRHSPECVTDSINTG
jgi:hypothetical protein